MLFVGGGVSEGEDVIAGLCLDLGSLEALTLAVEAGWAESLCRFLGGEYSKVVAAAAAAL